MEDTLQKINNIRKKRRRRRLFTVLGIIAAVLLILVVVGFFVVNNILNNPERYFDSSTVSIATPKPFLTPAIDIQRTEPPMVTPSPIPEEELAPNIVNIMLFGIDAHEDGGSTSGTVPHTDVNMVIAVNFDEKRVDLISLPRDTFTTVPGVNGFYKLNGVFNVGGGLENTEGGFELACRTAEMWLGGISIPYYYALDFAAVVDIVDALGGIDYDVDQSFTDFDGNVFHEGWQHLDGNGVLGYLRVRKEADGTDRSRTARQRRMMVAIFNKLKTEGSLSTVPSLISAANSGIYTNTTLSQTAALANYATELDPERIFTHVMDGNINMFYDWAFSFVHQTERIELIKEVYGIDVQPMGFCSARYERWLHESGFSAIKYIRQGEKVLTFANEFIAGNELSDEDEAIYADFYYAYEALLEAYNEASDWHSAHYNGSRGSYTADEKAEQSKLADNLNAKKQALKEAAKLLASVCGYDGEPLRWTIPKAWYNDSDINAVYVDFR